ncbi:MAG: DUF3626 domain-containing protein, partial [Defluviitaleaceae bacterium]|nr:DUF3626 domain-containing protein [Defluviitaleaceae bacterium]
GESTINSRPKYGSLNIFNYLDGASARFGSCFLTLKPHMLERCTFAYGDSSTNPDALGVKGAFHTVFRAILRDVEKTGRLLNKDGFTVTKTIDHILAMKKGELAQIGRNLDDCVETHVHGDISLKDDAGRFYIDESFRGTLIHGLAERLAKEYDIDIFWIPERKVPAADITDEFRGPAVPVLAKRAAEKFAAPPGYINAAVIGAASRHSVERPEEWADLGSEAEVFQYFKQLWHTAAYFG